VSTRGQAAPAFDPASVREFRFVGHTWSPATGHVELRYGLDDRPFIETFRFPAADPGIVAARGPAIARAVRLLHLVAGVSYYKAAVPREIVVDGAPPSPATAGALELLWTGGLGEFAWHNDLPWLGGGIRFPAASADPPPAAPAGLRARTLVPVGGGKDSAVALAALARAGEDVVALSVGRKPSADATAAAEGVPIVHVDRRLDPALFQLNREGALNGHVPITAIVTCAAAVAALILGCDAVAMANERSASAGTVEWAAFGGSVNHQFSKGWDAERAIAGAVRREVAADLDVFSILRPWSELAIARAFAALPEHHGTFMSCNRGFTIARESAQVWCGDCPKCRFVFLALAPFLPRDDLVAIFGRDLLDDPRQEGGFREVLGMGADKPFECVGEVDEARAALRAVAADPAWAGDAVVARLAPAAGGPDAGAIDPWLAEDGPHGIPERHLRAARALLGPRG
jgi:hypothetical protein